MVRDLAPRTNGQAAAAPPKPRLTRPASEVRRRNVTWLWQDRVVAGAMACVEARKGSGKSTLLAAIAAAVTGGPALPGGKPRRRGPILWLAGEEDIDCTVAPRLEAAGAKMKLVHFREIDEHLIARPLFLPTMLGELREIITTLELALVVMDPLVSFVDGGLCLTHDQDIHTVLDPVNALAHSTGCTVIFSRHLTKNRSSDPIDRGQGGAALGGCCKSILVVDRPERRLNRRVVRVVMCNLALGVVPDLEYFPDGQPGLATITNWTEVKASNEDEDDDCDRAERGRRADARLLLRELCAKEYVQVSVIVAEASAAALSLRTLERAKSDLDIDSRRIGTTIPARWEWGPPLGGWPEQGGDNTPGGVGSGGLAPAAVGKQPKTRKPRSKAAKDATE